MEDNIDNSFRYAVIEPMVPVPTSLSDYRAKENIINWSQFDNLDKVEIFKHASDMICVDVVKANKIETRSREALNKVQALLKDKKWTTRPK